MSPVPLSLLTAAAATLLALPFATGAAWILERTRWPGRWILQVAVTLPLVLPPVVVGYLLLLLLSPRSALGGTLDAIGIPVAFHWPGVLVAAAVSGFPLLVFSIAQGLRAVDPGLERISRSLGRGAAATFLRVTLPLARSGILSGLLLAFARGLGEFGATIVLAGRIPGETETIPLAIYAGLEAPGGGSKIAGLVAASILLGVGAVLLSRAALRNEEAP